MIVCPKCQKEIARDEPGDDFCFSCGYEWVGEEIIVEEQGELF